MTTRAPEPIYLKDYTAPDYQVDTLELRFELGEHETVVDATTLLRRNGDHQRALVLNGHDMVLIEVKLEGRKLEPVEYLVDDESLTIVKVPESFRLDIRTIVKPQQNTSLEGLYKSSETFCTQCEAEGFRKITYYLDRPDVMARFKTTISAEKKSFPVMLSNGNMVASGGKGDRHWVTWEDPYPKPSYLFALVAGDLACLEDQFVTRSGREVRLRIYTEHHNAHKCGHAMAALKKSMRWDEDVYGLEYDLDIFMIVAVDDFNMGAMENKGLNIFNSKYVLADPQTATDDDYAAIESVIAHEYFHNWTGNRVTLRDWFQLSLKEGLTVFRDQEFSADTFSRPLARIGDVRVLRSHQFPEDAGPMAHPVRPEKYIEINNFYTVTIYNKGAEVIRMMHTLLGAEAYRAGMDLYFKRHDGEAVTTDEFVAAMEDASGIDLQQFRRWYSQAGTPTLKITDDYDTGNQTYTLNVEQSCPASPDQPHKLPFHIPLAVGLLDDQGASMKLRLRGESEPTAQSTRVLDVRASTEQFVFDNLGTRPTPSLLRDFSAPVTLNVEQSAEQLAFLSAHDPNPFNRWDAGQVNALNHMLVRIYEIQQQQPRSPAPALVAAMRSTLTDTELEPGLVGEAMILPAESYVAEQLETVDVVAVHEVREALRREIATQLRDELGTVFEQCSSNAGYRFDPDEAGRRKLKNVCLAYLMETDDAQIESACLRQFKNADNMTDVLAAFRLLANLDNDQRPGVLADFLERWRDDALVLDKWFTTQATCKLPNTLAAVRELLGHPTFNIRNPNKVRALIGGFCFGNPVHFHAQDGSGYDFLAEQVRILDPMNPQIAARLLGALSRWRKFDHGRREKMSATLDSITKIPGLSKDTFEIASKTLSV